MNNVITMGKILTQISKNLSIASKVVPILNDYKPLLNNFKNIYKIISKDNKDEIRTIKNDIPKKETIKRTIKDYNSPQFFI